MGKSDRLQRDGYMQFHGIQSQYKTRLQHSYKGDCKRLRTRWQASASMHTRISAEFE